MSEPSRERTSAASAGLSGTVLSGTVPSDTVPSDDNEYTHGYQRYLRGHQRWRRHSRGVTLWLPVVVSFLFQVVPVLIPRGYWLGTSDGYTGVWLLGLIIMLIGPVALVAARRFPGPVVAVVALASTLSVVVGGQDLPPYVALGFAVVSAIVRGARIWAWVSVGVTWALSLWLIVSIGTQWYPFRIAAVTLAILVLFGIGEAIRNRREHLEEYAKDLAQRQQSEVQAERVRIARELHDVLAHSLSQINVQAGVGLHLMDSQPDQARQALASIKLASKSALDEVRSVLGALRSGEGTDPSAPLVPEPDLTRLSGLVESFSSQGIAVSVSNALTTAPPAAIQLALYRIIQESLTNVGRHAQATAATVELHEADGFYAVTITDNGAAHGVAVEVGRGLMGMRERAELLGGTFDAGRGDSGFTVRATIPMKERAE